MAVFDDALFIWNPGDANTASFDEVSETSASGLTEGTITTETIFGATRTGRVYDGTVGSRIATSILSGDQSGGMTVMAVVQSPVEVEDYVTAVWFGNNTQGNHYVQLMWHTVPQQSVSPGWWGAGYRRNGGTSTGGSGWAVGRHQYSPTEGGSSLEPHVIIATFTSTDDGYVTRLYLDGELVVTSSAWAVLPIAVNQLTIGRMDDTSPFNSGGGAVYTAVVWGQVLTDDEAAEVAANPFNDPVEVATYDPSGAFSGDFAFRSFDALDPRPHFDIS